MNVTMDAVEPPYTSTVSEPSGNHYNYLFVAGFFITAVLLFTITYAAYMCKRPASPSPPPHDISFTYGNHRDLIMLSRGLDDDVLETFPVFVYSDITVPEKGDTATAAAISTSGCSICLVDYKPQDILRLLPECGHVFHVSCIDKWLKAHPTCPVCRNSPHAGMVPGSINLTSLIN